mmetsp:Transcript_6297/g.26152  ORF Transcript_6297/g.26152 Transcript_6297/m.26152 type:complete len:263 (+) Transcript_6297:333-1121(+)
MMGARTATGMATGTTRRQRPRLAASRRPGGRARPPGQGGTRQRLAPVSWSGRRAAAQRAGAAPPSAASSPPGSTSPSRACTSSPSWPFGPTTAACFAPTTATCPSPGTAPRRSRPARSRSAPTPRTPRPSPPSARWASRRRALAAVPFAARSASAARGPPSLPRRPPARPARPWPSAPKRSWTPAPASQAPLRLTRTSFPPFAPRGRPGPGLRPARPAPLVAVAGGTSWTAPSGPLPWRSSPGACRPSPTRRRSPGQRSARL